MSALAYKRYDIMDPFVDHFMISCNSDMLLFVVLSLSLIYFRIFFSNLSAYLSFVFLSPSHRLESGPYLLDITDKFLIS